MNTARESFRRNVGIQTAALAFGGYTGTAYTGATEEYNGTSWTNNPVDRFKYSKNLFSRSRYTNCSIRFWW
jgi:hypothetical protein